MLQLQCNLIAVWHLSVDYLIHLFPINTQNQNDINLTLQISKNITTASHWHYIDIFHLCFVMQFSVIIIKHINLALHIEFTINVTAHSTNINLTATSDWHHIDMVSFPVVTQFSVIIIKFISTSNSYSSHHAHIKQINNSYPVVCIEEISRRDPCQKGKCCEITHRIQWVDTTIKLSQVQNIFTEGRKMSIKIWFYVHSDSEHTGTHCIHAGRHTCKPAPTYVYIPIHFVIYGTDMHTNIYICIHTYTYCTLIHACIHTIHIL